MLKKYSQNTSISNNISRCLCMQIYVKIYSSVTVTSTHQHQQPLSRISHRLCMQIYVKNYTSVRVTPSCWLTVYIQANGLLLLLVLVLLFVYIFTARRYAERGYEIACLPSVRPSVCDVQVPWSNRLVYVWLHNAYNYMTNVCTGLSKYSDPGLMLIFICACDSLLL